MKHFYFSMRLLAVLFAMSVTYSFAQQTPSTTGKARVGYAQGDEFIYEHDGLSLDHDARVGCAIVLTGEMLKPYVGGTVKAMRVGWDTSESTGVYDGFVRRSFNGEDLSTGRATVRYNLSSSEPGWNTMTMSDYVIPEDVDSLVVGFFTNLKKGVCAIPTLLPAHTPRSCFLYVEGGVDANGDPLWVDMNTRGILPILLVIQDTQGTFNYMASIKLLTHDGIATADTDGSCLLRIKNLGSQTIRNIEVTSRQGDRSSSTRVALTKTVAPGTVSGAFLAPLHYFASGDTEFCISKVNGEANSHEEQRTLPLISVPQTISDEFNRRPLVEYYESENNYMSPRYYEEIVAPTLRGKLRKLTFVCQHLDDQFMTGEDDATVLCLQLCDNDSSAVSIPAMTIDRAMSTANILYQQNSMQTPMFSVLYDPYASQAYEAAISVPTFLDVNAEGSLREDGQTIDINVSGDIYTSCLPAGETPRLTVYLMERDVYSDSQVFWTDKEKEETLGEFTHTNVIREILSDRDGDALRIGEEITLSGAEGTPDSFEKTYRVELAPDWNKRNLYLVAFVHRDGAKGGKYMHVFNSDENEIDLSNGISTVTTRPTSEPTAVYDLQGRRISTPGRGISIVGNKKIIR